MKDLLKEDKYPILYQNWNYISKMLLSLCQLNLKVGDKIGISSDGFYISGESFRFNDNSADAIFNIFRKSVNKVSEVVSRKIYAEGHEKMISNFNMLNDCVNQFIEMFKNYIKSHNAENPISTQEFDSWIDGFNGIRNEWKVIVKNLETLKLTYKSNFRAVGAISKFLNNLELSFRKLNLMTDEYKKDTVYSPSGPMNLDTSFLGSLRTSQKILISDQNINTMFDLHYRKLCIIRGAIMCLGYFQDLMIDLNIIEDNYKSKKLFLENEFKINDAYENFNNDELSSINFISSWNKISSYETEVIHHLKPVFEDIFRHEIKEKLDLNSIDPNMKKLYMEIEPLILNSFEKFFSLFVHASHSEYRLEYKTINARLTFDDDEFIEEAKRISPAYFIYNQILLDIKYSSINEREKEEITRFIINAPCEGEYNFNILRKNIIEETSTENYNINAIKKNIDIVMKALIYKNMMKIQSFRSSMESKLTHIYDPYNKKYLTSNAWRVKFSYKNHKPLRIMRCGAFTDFSNSDKNIHSIRDYINEKAQILKEDPYHKCASEVEKLDIELENRKQIVMNMALPMILESAALIGEEIEQDIKHKSLNFNYMTKEFYYTQISLLKTKKKSPEYNMSMDIDWVMDFFNGKILVYDGECGYSSHDQLIHVQYPLIDEETSEPLRLTLKITLYSIDVFSKNNQQYTHLNTMNSKTISSLGERFSKFISFQKKWRNELINLDKLSEIHSRIEKNLIGHNYSFDISEEIACFENMIGSYVIINCKSGKDRTGTLVNLIYAKHIHSFLPYLNVGDLQNLTMKKGTSLFITGINTFVKGFKLHPTYLIGLNLLEKFSMAGKTIVISS